MAAMAGNRARSIAAAIGGAVMITACAACSSGSAPAAGPGSTAAGTASRSAVASGSPAPASPSATLAPNSHQVNLSAGETKALDAELLTVEGFDYVDVPAAEREAALKNVPEGEPAAIHVVTRTGSSKEVGFLMLLAPSPTDAMWAPSKAAALAASVLGGKPAVWRTIGGVPVYAARDASAPASAYKYAWWRHGTLAWLDGPEQAPLETFVTSYLATPFRGAEVPALGARMVAPSGYAFSNASNLNVFPLEAALPGAASSLHYVFDRTHMFGGLLLVTPPPTTSVGRDTLLKVASAIAAVNRTAAPAALSRDPVITVGDVQVFHGTDPSTSVNYYVWTWPGSSVLGALITPRGDLAPGFLRAYVPAAA